MLYSQINSDYKEIAQKKIKAVYFGDTTLEDYVVFLYDSDGFFIEKQIFNNFMLNESIKFEKDGISREELEMCCIEYKRNPFRCIKSDTCSCRKIQYDEKFRLVCLIGEYFQDDWGETYDAFEKSCFKCNEHDLQRICTFEEKVIGVQYLANFSNSDLEELKKKYYSISELDAYGNELSCQSFMIYNGDTVRSDYSGGYDPGNRKSFYSKNNILLAKEYFYFTGTGNKNYYREEYDYKRNGEIKKIAWYSREMPQDSCIFNCDSLWYLSADELNYNNIENGKWIKNNAKICFPKYKKLNTVIPEYNDWLKWQKLTFHSTLEFMYDKYPISTAFKIEYWD